MKRLLSDLTLLALVGGELDHIDSRLVVEAARRGDVIAAAVIQAATERFALGLFNLMMVFHPEMIVLSGGVMRSSDLFMPAIERVQTRANIYIPADRIHIRMATLGYYAGIYGAAYAILRSIRHE